MRIHKSAMLILSVLAFSCSKNNVGSGEGYIRFSIANRTDVADVTKSSVVDYTEVPATGAFVISIKNSDDEIVWDGLISEWQSGSAMEAGDYTVTASYGEEGNEGFDKPYFTGSVSFSVIGGHATEVTIPVALGNTIIKMACTDAFNNYFPDYAFQVTTGMGTAIDFPKGESRATFVDAFRITLSGTLTSQSGKTSAFNPVEYKNLKAKTCYTLRFDAADVGGVSVTVSFNDSVETIFLGDIELND